MIRCLRWFVVSTLFFLCLPSVLAQPRRTVAVIDFQNVNKDKNLDWLGTGIAETLTTQLSRLSQITVVERTRLHAALKEIKFSRSESVDPETASQVGKVIGADSIVLGSYQKFEQQIRLAARLVDVETGKVAAPTSVDGTYQKIFELQDSLAANLSREIVGALGAAASPAQESARPSGLDAYQLFSEGVYFLRNDLVQDALTRFDQALTRDPAYSEAHFYRGLALEKLKRWSEAAEALKRALPRSQPVRSIKWSWDVPYEGRASDRGQVVLLDEKWLGFRDHFSKEGTLKASEQIVYTERVDKNTVLHLVDLRERSVHRLVIPAKLPLMQLTFGNSEFAAILGESPQFGDAAYKVPLFVISPAAGRLLGQGEVDVSNPLAHPFPFVRGTTMYLMFPLTNTMRAFDVSTGRFKWQRTDLTLLADWTFAQTRTQGDVAILRSVADKKLYVIRANDGRDAWTAELASREGVASAVEGMVVLLEPRRRVAAFDLETGKMVGEFDVKPSTISVDLGPGLSLRTVPRAVQGSVLYFAAEDKTLCAADFGREGSAADRLRWKTSLGRDVHSLRPHGDRVYVGTDSGELIILDALTGRQLTTAKVARKNLVLEDVDAEMILARSGPVVFALEATTAAKKWEHAGKFAQPEPQRFKNVVIVRSDRKQLSVLDAATGSVLWQYVGKRIPAVHTTKDSLFVAEETGVKEYIVEAGATPGLTDKEVFTKLAGVLMQQGNHDEAGRLLDKITGEIDPDYPEARYLKAGLMKARGERRAALRELVAYFDLLGQRSQRAQEILDELKRDYGLLWRAQSDGGNPGNPEQAGGRIVSTGFVVTKHFMRTGSAASKDLQILALDVADGKVAWRHPGDHFLAASLSPDSARMFYATGEEQDPQRVGVFDVEVATGEPRKLATLAIPGTGGVGFADFAFSDKRAYLQILSADAAAQKQWVIVTAFDRATGTKLWERTFEFSIAVEHIVGITAWGDYVAFALGKDLWVLRGADGVEYARHRAEADFHSGASISPDGILYVATGERAALAYDLAGKKVVLLVKLGEDEVDAPLAGRWVRDRILYDFDGRSVFAVDFRSETPKGAPRLMWRLEAGPERRFEAIRLAERLLVKRDDSVLLELDPATGKVLSERGLFWDSDGMLIRGDTAFVLNRGGTAYAFRLGSSDATAKR